MARLDIALREDGFNQDTKRYGFARDPVTSDVRFDDTQAFAVMGQAMFKRGYYWANDTLGSNAHTLKSLTSRTPTQAEAMVLDAEQALVDEGLINAPTVDASTASDEDGNRLMTQISWTTPSGAGGNGGVAV